MNPVYELIITWEVTWFPDDSDEHGDEERKEYTTTTESFYEDDDVNSVDDFLEKSDEMFQDERFEPEADIYQYLEEGGDVNIDYVKISDSNNKELWRDPSYTGE